MRRTATVWMVIAMLATLSAGAQDTTGAISGTITSQDGMPLPAATVRIIDPETGLTQRRRSGSDGRYRFTALPPASYELSATRDGFKSVTRSVRVELGRTVTSDIEMEIGAVTETIEVTAETPQIDVTSTVAGMSTNTDDLLAVLPIHREITHIALLAPGTYVSDTNWQAPGAMGLFTPGQEFVSFSGSSFGENAYLVNGLNITNFRRMLGSSFVPMEFVEEVEVKTGGYEAEFGRSTGGVINMVSKRGTNSLRGGLSAYWQPDSLREQSPNTRWRHGEEEEREALEINASLGGPIIRDRLFYFGFIRYGDTRFTDYLSDPDRADLHEWSAPYWGGKLDWNVTSEHRLEGTYLSDDVDVDFTQYGYDPETQTLLDVRGTGVRRRGGDNMILAYTGVLSERLLLSAQAGRNEFDRTNVSDGDECPVVVDDRGPDRRYPGCWVQWTRRLDHDTRTAYRVDLDWVMGRHSLRAGADYELNVAAAVEESSGGVVYNYYLNGSPEQAPDDYRFPHLPWNQHLATVFHDSTGGSFDVISRAAYVQDSWAVTPNLTLNVGVRWEAYENKNGLGQTFIETDDQWAPRVGVVWDPSGVGRSKLYASFGTYHLPVSAQVNIWYAGARDRELAVYAFDGDLAADGSPLQLGDRLSHSVSDDGTVSDSRENISDNFDPMAQNEVTVGFERQLGRDWTVGVRGVARWYEQVIEDYSIYEGLWNAYHVPCLDPELLPTDNYCWTNGFRLGNPGRDFEGWYDIDGDDELERVFIPAEALGYPEAQRDYYAVELTAGRRFVDGWMLQGSYTWSHLYGNYEGTISDEPGNTLAGMHEAFDYPYVMENSSGDLPGDMRHRVRLFGSYAWDSGLQVGGNFWYQTGRPVNSYGRHPNDPWARQDPYLSFYTGGEPRPRGCCGRTDAVWALDLMLKYDFSTLGAGWNVRLDVFNVFDTQNALWASFLAEFPGNGVPYEGYGEPFGYQPPRTVRLGFGVSF